MNVEAPIGVGCLACTRPPILRRSSEITNQGRAATNDLIHPHYLVASWSTEMTPEFAPSLEASMILPPDVPTKSDSDPDVPMILPIRNEATLLTRADALAGVLEKFQSECPSNLSQTISENVPENEDRIRDFMESVEDEFFELMYDLTRLEVEHLRTIDDPALLFTHMDGFAFDLHALPSESAPTDPFLEVARLESAVGPSYLGAGSDADPPELRHRLEQAFPYDRDCSTFTLTEFGIDRDHVNQLLKNLYEQNAGYRSVRAAENRLKCVWDRYLY